MALQLALQNRPSPSSQDRTGSFKNALDKQRFLITFHAPGLLITLRMTPLMRTQFTPNEEGGK